MGRLLGLDYGTRTVGVAVSDGLGLTAQALETITRTHENKLRKTLQRIEELIAEYEVTEIVLGYPLNMDDSEGPRAAAAKEFKKMLERRTRLPVVLEDERLTTVAAEEILIEAGVPRENRKAVIDKIAASLILESYMERMKNSGRPGNGGQDHQDQET
ncbi:MAG: Holliday junction resolvase RuvX [Lachnospiraceae bacterium]